MLPGDESTWDLTEEGGGVFAEGSSHTGVQSGPTVTCWQLRSAVVTTLIIVVFNIQVDQLREVNAQCAA